MDDIVLTRTLCSQGFDDRDLRRMRRDGTLIPVRRGAYVRERPAERTFAESTASRSWRQLRSYVMVLSLATPRRLCCTGCLPGKARWIGYTSRGTAAAGGTGALLCRCIPRR
jgi:hypothetical protein